MRFENDIGCQFGKQQECRRRHNGTVFLHGPAKSSAGCRTHAIVTAGRQGLSPHAVRNPCPPRGYDRIRHPVASGPRPVLLAATQTPGPRLRGGPVQTPAVLIADSNRGEIRAEPRGEPGREDDLERTGSGNGQRQRRSHPVVLLQILADQIVQRRLAPFGMAVADGRPEVPAERVDGVSFRKVPADVVRGSNPPG